ncbi:MAG: DUF6153 family protein [Actinomycetota bacterium]|nr:DUF6153 family protein [Actinomycetota bacterium]
MTARDPTRQRVCRSWIARAVLAVVVIGGLFAMHGLAGTGAVEMGHAGAVPSQAMASEDMVHTLPADPDLGPSSASMVLASLVRTTEVPAGCGMDHTNCVAVLRAEHHTAPVAVLTAIVAIPPDHAAPERDRLARCDSRAPPDISLTRLCISRT